MKLESFYSLRQKGISNEKNYSYDYYKTHKHTDKTPVYVFSYLSVRENVTIRVIVINTIDSCPWVEVS